MNKKPLYIFGFIDCCFKYIPVYSLAIILFNIANGLVPVLQIAVTTKFINMALESANTGIFSNAIYLQIFFLVLIVAYNWLSFSAVMLINTKAQLVLQQRYRGTVLEKCAKLRYQYIEDPGTWDLISRMADSPEATIIKNFSALLQLCATAINVAGVIAFIVVQVWWAALAIIICCVPLFWLSIKSGKANYNANRLVARAERKYNYLSTILSDRDSIDERTVFGYSDKINEEYYKAYKEAFTLRVMTALKWFVKMKLGGAFTAFAGVIVILVLLGPTVSGVISIGLFISIVNAIFSLTQQLSWGLSRRIDTLVRGREFLKDMDKLMHLEETQGALLSPVYGTTVTNIEFRNVSFTYPGTEIQILNNVSFNLDGGKHYAFVGANGAGKTTIIKLLTGLYTNYTGEILINGKDLRAYDSAELKGLFSVVYQDFVKHSFTLRENCAVGNVALLEKSENDDEIYNALHMTELSELTVKLPNGIHTNLGKIHADGVDLSGGQWQRLAMSRAIISPAPVRILDEPTAALDPISESHIYELFGKISHNALTIFISHRLGSTKIADEILVFSGGTVKEQGSYEILMENKGLYYEMFEQQRSWYQ